MVSNENILIVPSSDELKTRFVLNGLSARLVTGAVWNFSVSTRILFRDQTFMWVSTLPVMRYLAVDEYTQQLILIVCISFRYRTRLPLKSYTYKFRSLQQYRWQFNESISIFLIHSYSFFNLNSFLQIINNNYNNN